MLNNIWGYAFIFTINVVDDVLSVLYVQNVHNGDALRSSMVSVFKVIVYAISIMCMIKSLWYIIPTVCGAFVGTYAAVKWGERKEEK